MTINNIRNKSFLTLIIFISVLCGVGGLIAQLILAKFYGQFYASLYYLTLFFGILTIVFVLRGRQIFEYDSDGKSLLISNKRVLPLFFKKNVYVEIRKVDFESYKLTGFPFRRLLIESKNEKGEKQSYKFDISFLSRDERNLLVKSLAKLARLHREGYKVSEIENS